MTFFAFIVAAIVAASILSGMWFVDKDDMGPR
jgi:hypothetical protein